MKRGGGGSKCQEDIKVPRSAPPSAMKRRDFELNSFVNHIVHPKPYALRILVVVEG